MADETTGLLAQWISEAKEEIRTNRDNLEKLRGEHNTLKIEHERLKTKINTRTTIIWAAIGLAIALGGFVIALITLLA